MKLTTKQHAVLERGGANGTVINYSVVWVLDSQSVTGTVNQLIRKGLLRATYYRGGQASAWITDEGRKALDTLRQAS